jgi:hypothetical protein
MKIQDLKQWLKNRTVLILLIIVTVLNFVDLFISLPFLDIESNPLAIFTGSFFTLIFIKVLFNIGLFLIYYTLKAKGSSFIVNYTYAFLLVTLCYIFIQVIFNNLQTVNTPELLEASRQVSNEVKIQFYKSTMFKMYLYPVLLSIGTSIVYSLENNVK